MRNIIKNKQGQAESIIVFFILIVAILITSVVVLKMVNVIVTPLGNQLGNVSSTAGGAVHYVQNKFTSFWDTAIILIFGVNILILFISAFLIDVHPAFVVVYIIAIIFLFIFGNSVLGVLDAIWNVLAPTGSAEALASPMQIFIINHFQLLMMVIVVLSGIIMYSKIKFFNQGEGIGGNY